MNALNQLVEDPDIKEDAAKEAEVTAQYWEALLKLQDLGVEEHMHVGKPQEFFDDPKNMAEYVAGQLVGIEGDKIPNVRQAMHQVKEHSEDPLKITEKTSMYTIPTENISPTLKNWMVLRSMVNIAHMFLASDLDRPPKT